MTTITTDNAHEFECHKWTAEASTLGLAPGEWPRTLPTNLGNGRDFLLAWMNGEGACYVQQLGCLRLQVFND